MVRVKGVEPLVVSGLNRLCLPISPYSRNTLAITEGYRKEVVTHMKNYILLRISRRLHRKKTPFSD